VVQPADVSVVGHHRSLLLFAVARTLSEYIGYWLARGLLLCECLPCSADAPRL
jgi:hypothetical protein